MDGVSDDVDIVRRDNFRDSSETAVEQPMIAVKPGEASLQHSSTEPPKSDANHDYNQLNEQIEASSDMLHIDAETDDPRPFDSQLSSSFSYNINPGVFKDTGTISGDQTPLQSVGCDEVLIDANTLSHITSCTSSHKQSLDVTTKSYIDPRVFRDAVAISGRRKSSCAIKSHEINSSVALDEMFKDANSQDHVIINSDSEKSPPAIKPYELHRSIAESELHTLSQANNSSGSAKLHSAGKPSEMHSSMAYDAMLTGSNTFSQISNSSGSQKLHSAGKSSEMHSSMAHDEMLTGSYTFSQISNSSTAYEEMLTTTLRNTSDAPVPARATTSFSRVTGTPGRRKSSGATAKTYECDACDRIFSDSRNLKRHKRVHSGARPYRCDVCQKCFSQSSILTRHRRSHSGERPYSCEICAKSFTASGHLSRHRRLHLVDKPYTCFICDKAYSCSTDLTRHLRCIHSGESATDYHVLCDVCGKTFTKMTKYRVHSRTHKGQKPHSCDVCSRAFHDLRLLAEHRRIHSADRPFECSACGTTFRQSSCLRRHVSSVHAGLRPHVCDICQKAFSQSCQLANHKIIHSGEKPFKCQFCHKAFNRLGNLNSHKANMHVS